MANGNKQECQSAASKTLSDETFSSFSSDLPPRFRAESNKPDSLATTWPFNASALLAMHEIFYLPQSNALLGRSTKFDRDR